MIKTRQEIPDSTSNSSPDGGAAIEVCPLTSFIINLKSIQEVATLSFSAPAIFNTVKNLFPSLQPSEYRVSELRGETEEDLENNCIFFLKGNTYWFRVSTLTPEASQTIQETFKKMAREGSLLSLNNGCFEVQGVIAGRNTNTSSGGGIEKINRPEQLKWVRSNNYEQIFNNSFLKNTLTFNFVSPAILSDSGNQSVFPLPKTLFNDLEETYLEHNKEDKTSFVSEQSLEKIETSSYSLETTTIFINGVSQAGFRGKCCFDLQKCSEEEKKHFNALAAIGFYAGAGENTTSGMGQFWLSP